MAELHKIRFLFLVSLMIFRACAVLEVLLVSPDGARCHIRSEITFDNENGERHFSNSNPGLYLAQPGITKVIVYINGMEQMKEQLKHSCRDQRMAIAHKLHPAHSELLFLALTDFREHDESFVARFLFETIRFTPDVSNFEINTLGEGHFDLNYVTPIGLAFPKYKEKANVCDEDLQGLLRSVHEEPPSEEHPSV